MTGNPFREPQRHLHNSLALRPRPADGEGSPSSQTLNTFEIARGLSTVREEVWAHIVLRR